MAGNRRTTSSRAAPKGRKTTARKKTARKKTARKKAGSTHNTHTPATRGAAARGAARPGAGRGPARRGAAAAGRRTAAQPAATGGGVFGDVIRELSGGGSRVTGSARVPAQTRTGGRAAVAAAKPQQRAARTRPVRRSGTPRRGRGPLFQ